MYELGTPRHLLDQGLRRAESGDLDGASEVLVEAANSGDPEVAPQAANVLGLLYGDRDPALAERAFRFAIDSGHLDHGSRAAFELASLYRSQGNQSEALRLYGLATSSPRYEVATAAREAVRAMEEAHTELTTEMSPAEIAFTEGVQLRAAGDLPGALSALRRCIASEDPEYAPYAGCQLGAILGAEGDPENAKDPLWLAVRSGHPTYAPVSAYLLVEILLAEGDRAAAHGLLPLATRHPDPEAARWAASMLAGPS